MTEDRLDSKKIHGFTCRPQPHVIEWLDGASEALGISFSEFSAQALEFVYMLDTCQIRDIIKMMKVR